MPLDYAERRLREFKTSVPRTLKQSRIIGHVFELRTFLRLTILLHYWTTTSLTLCGALAPCRSNLGVTSCCHGRLKLHLSIYGEVSKTCPLWEAGYRDLVCERSCSFHIFLLCTVFCIKPIIYHVKASFSYFPTVQQSTFLSIFSNF